MLKKCVSHAMAGMALLVLAAGAARADGPYRRGPGPGPGMVILEPPPIFTWSGFYIGGNIGAAWSNSTLTDDASVLSYTQSHSGFIGGGQLGYNYQIRNLVLGIEWDFDWTSIGETRNGLFLGNAFQASADTDWMTTLSGRVGLTVERWLMYMKIGGGWVRNSASITNLTTGVSASAKQYRWSLAGWSRRRVRHQQQLAPQGRVQLSRLVGSQRERVWRHLHVRPRHPDAEIRHQLQILTRDRTAGGTIVWSHWRAAPESFRFYIEARPSALSLSKGE